MLWQTAVRLTGYGPKQADHHNHILWHRLGEQRISPYEVRCALRLRWGECLSTTSLWGLMQTAKSYSTNLLLCNIQTPMAFSLMAAQPSLKFAPPPCYARLHSGPIQCHISCCLHPIPAGVLQHNHNTKESKISQYQEQSQRHNYNIGHRKSSGTYPGRTSKTYPQRSSTWPPIRLHWNTFP